MLPRAFCYQFDLKKRKQAKMKSQLLESSRKHLFLLHTSGCGSSIWWRFWQRDWDGNTFCSSQNLLWQKHSIFIESLKSLHWTRTQVKALGLPWWLAPVFLSAWLHFDCTAIPLLITRSLSNQTYSCSLRPHLLTILNSSVFSLIIILISFLSLPVLITSPHFRIVGTVFFSTHLECNCSAWT